jgi:hypothetical protein
MTTGRSPYSTYHTRGTLRLLADRAAVDRLADEPRATAQARLEAAVGPALLLQLELLLGVRLRPAAEEVADQLLLAA